MARAFYGIAKVLSKGRDNCSGAVAVESAFVLPAFLFLIFAVVEAGWLFWTQSSLQSAVEAAARCAALNCSGDIQGYAASQAQVVGLTIDKSSFSVSQPSCGHQVSISYPFTFIDAQIVPTSITLNAKSCHP